MNENEFHMPPTRRLPHREAKEKNKLTAGKVIRRILLCFLALLLFICLAVYSACYLVANGPSPTVRNLLVLSALQASATKWAPSLFLPEETVKGIVSDSEVVVVDKVKIDDINPPASEGGETVDEWANAPDGIQIITETGTNFKAYIMIIKDPSRVFVGPTYDYASSNWGVRIIDACRTEGAVGAINGGEFYDGNGQGTGNAPMGLTYSKGECVWDSDNDRTFMGFDKDDKLVIYEGMTRERADKLGIRDAVSFQYWNTLISNKDGVVNLYYANYNNGTAQRTAIAQRADGAVILFVTDGRSANSLGATRNDVIDMLVKYGAVTAGMLDGGSSAMMYRENYWEDYDGYDYDKLDEFQKLGLVNKYKAFTNPRRIPTYFMVRSSEE